MKRWTVYSLAILIALGGLTGCGSADTPTPTLSSATFTPSNTPMPSPTPVPSPIATGLGPNLLLETRGEVSLKRDEWQEYALVPFGTEVRWGDLVRPAAGATAKILCADLSLHTVVQEGQIPCRVEKPVLTYGSVRLVTPRAPTQPIPYTLHPRNTTVLDPRPLLRWHDTGAAGYTVAIYQGGEILWQQIGVPANEIHYPTGAPELQSDVDYLLSVTDEETNHHSGEDPARGLGFRVLGANERATVEKQRDAIMSLPLDDTGRLYTLAVYYAGHRLRGEALALLEEISITVDAPTVQLWRGDLLLAMQLPGKAEAAYQAALAAAQNLGYREAQAAARVGLWHVTTNEDHLNTAVTLYKELGDDNKAAELGH